MRRWITVGCLLGTAMAVAWLGILPRLQAPSGEVASSGAAPPAFPAEPKLARGGSSARSGALHEERTGAAGGTLRYLLRVSIEGLPAAESVPVAVHAEPGHMGCLRIVGEEVDAEAPSHGTEEIDVTPVLRRGYESLSLRVTHPRAADRWVGVAVPARPQGWDGTLRMDATVTLEPVAAIVGRLTSQGGAPHAGRVEAHAVVGRLPSPSAYQSVSTADGHFRLRLPESGPWVIVAQADGLLPAAVRASGVVGQDTDLGNLVCAAGLEIRGRVVSDAPLTEVVAEPTAAAGASRTWIAPGLLWRGERAEPAVVHASIQKDGTYALGGLAPGTYRVSVRGSGVDPSGASSAERVVSAPATGVDLTLRAAAVTVELQGRAHEDVSASISASGRRPWSRYWYDDQSDSWTLWVTPQTDCRLRIGSRAFAPVDVDFRTPGPGEGIVREIRLARRATKPGSLSIEVRDEQGAVPATARFSFAPADGSLGFEREADAVDGLFHLDSIPAGEYEVDGAAGDRCTHSPDHVPNPARVAVAPGSDTRATLVCLRGGRAAMIARDTDRTRLTPRCDVRLRDGAAIADAVFLPPLEFLELRMFDAYGSLSGIGEQEEMYPALLPGEYEATFSLDGYQTVTVPFRIVGGETTTVAVTMHRR